MLEAVSRQPCMGAWRLGPVRNVNLLHSDMNTTLHSTSVHTVNTSMHGLPLRSSIRWSFRAITVVEMRPGRYNSGISLSPGTRERGGERQWTDGRSSRALRSLHTLLSQQKTRRCRCRRCYYADDTRSTAQLYFCLLTVNGNTTDNIQRRFTTLQFLSTFGSWHWGEAIIIRAATDAIQTCLPIYLPDCLRLF